MMNYSEIIQVKYPNAKSGVDFQVVVGPDPTEMEAKFDENGIFIEPDNSKISTGVRITEWHLPDPKPTLAELAAYAASEAYKAVKLGQVKTQATAIVNEAIDKQISESGLMPQSDYAAQIVADVGFIVNEWTAKGKPEKMPQSIAKRVETEAVSYKITPLQMIKIWEQKWQKMRDGLAPILARRRAKLLAIEAAVSIEQIEAVLTAEG